MKKKFLVSAFCSGGPGYSGMGTVRMYVEYDSEKPTEEFFKAARSAMFMAGYTAILHWDAIDGCKAAKCVFDVPEQKALIDMVFKVLADKQVYANMLKALQESERYDREAEIGDTGRKTFKFNDKWSVGGGWTVDSLHKLIMQKDAYITAVSDTLRALGVDVDDTEDKKRILTNLGFYRVSMT